MVAGAAINHGGSDTRCFISDAGGDSAEGSGEGDVFTLVLLLERSSERSAADSCVPRKKKEKKNGKTSREVGKFFR